MKGKFDFCRLAPWWEDMRSRVQRKNTYAMVECVERCGIFRCCLALHEMTSVTSYHLDAGHARTKWPSLAAGTPYFFVSLGRVNVDCKKLVASHSRIPGRYIPIACHYNSIPVHCIIITVYCIDISKYIIMRIFCMFTFLYVFDWRHVLPMLCLARELHVWVYSDDVILDSLFFN